MDVNGTPFWQIADRTAFGFTEGADTSPANLAWNAQHGAVRLAGEQAAPDFAEDEAFSRDMAARPSPVCDDHGSFAWWDAASLSVLASGFAPGSALLELEEDDPIGVPQPTDMAFCDDRLLLARNDGVLIHDLRGRWPDARAEQSGFDAHLIAPRLKPRARKSREVFCYFDNDIKVRAPYDARRLLHCFELDKTLATAPGEPAAEGVLT